MEVHPGSHRNVRLCEVGTSPNCLGSPSPLSQKLVSAGTRPQEAISLWSTPQSYLPSLFWISPRPYLWNAVIWGIPVCFCCKVCSHLHYFCKAFSMNRHIECLTELQALLNSKKNVSFCCSVAVTFRTTYTHWVIFSCEFFFFFIYFYSLEANYFTIL